MFHAIQGLTATEKNAANVRVFEGDGTPFLRVPGLVKVESVRVGTTEIPLVITMDVPQDASLTKMMPVPVPMIDLQETDDGEKILLRSQFSNDGMWQKGARIYVGGEWEDEQGKEVSAIVDTFDPAQPGVGSNLVSDAELKGNLEVYNVDALKRIAEEAGIDLAGATRKADIIEVLAVKLPR
jgi:hypothetical protein